MSSTICTLFAGNHHYGVAALANSLYNQGYRGAIHVGYKGNLPFWSSMAKENASLDWPGGCTLEVVEGLKLNFLPFTTEHHLSNCKAEFMLRLWDGLASDATAMFYIDPDIIINTPWTSLEGWLAHGIALCEDVNSPLPEHHPIRAAWRSYFGSRGFSLSMKDTIYANAGFVGVSNANRNFIVIWQALMQAMAPAIGGLEHSGFTSEEPLLFAPFGNCDQDALNAAIEVWDGVASFVGKEGMAFTTGTSLMSHAIGRNKPWEWNPLVQAMHGRPPRRADRDYWNGANSPIIAQPAGLIWQRQLAIKIASFIGRFYRRY